MNINNRIQVNDIKNCVCSISSETIGELFRVDREGVQKNIEDAYKLLEKALLLNPKDASLTFALVCFCVKIEGKAGKVSSAGVAYIKTRRLSSSVTVAAYCRLTGSRKEKRARSLAEKV